MMKEKVEKALQNLKGKRLERGISLRKLAQKLGVSVQYLSMLERGKAAVSLERFLSICYAIGVEPSEVLPRETVEKDGEDEFAEKSKRLSAQEKLVLLDVLNVLHAHKTAE